LSGATPTKAAISLCVSTPSSGSWATKVIGRFPGETSCLTLCWAVLDLFLAGAHGLGNRLKLIKRTMYGKVKFDLLRKRVLLAC